MNNFKMICVRVLSVCVGLILFLGSNAQDNKMIQIIYLSDVHYGLTKKVFRGKENVSSDEVNKAILKEINNLQKQILPSDNGVGQNQMINHIDALIVTGDLANREEKGIQSATKSWAQFEKNYIKDLHTKDRFGKITPIYLTPGNHDASNAIGYFKPLNPSRDNKSMVEIYNRMLHPHILKTTTTFDYEKDVPNYAINIGSIHLIFPSIWPDSANRIWMENDLNNVKRNTPVLIFTHVPPYGDPKLFTNPNIPATINSKNKFENLLREKYKESLVIDKYAKDSIEQNGLDIFLYKHPNIKAYFHGHENHNEFYTYKGVDGKLSLPVFRVDSPMKGSISSKDEIKCSFQLITIDENKRLLSVRECLYNAHPNEKDQNITWGVSKTISL
ncbi:metallophosphoesterase family protein [Rhizosphaericola mali]|uniref:Metallophosphoesterase n=1 Tax=Rhizosphaericola mali TaxID=2545455 RepID=A0A5P2GEL6_9BACT|nr:metallophosphoesterase [Rhizosphaericola mali]QES90051.1 metallophosphoesterase [Rhizosphaericola mali]